MEPLFFKAENLVEAAKLAPLIAASMEPLFFKAENVTLTRLDCAATLLQWSRFFSKRKIRSTS